MTDSRTPDDELSALEEQQAQVIDRLSNLLTHIAVILKGPPPENGWWSFHDLPELVAALKARAGES